MCEKYQVEPYSKCHREHDVRHSENKYVMQLKLLWNEVQAAVPLIFIAQQP